MAKAFGTPGRRARARQHRSRRPASLARAIAFVAQTPARMVVVPMWSPRKRTGSRCDRRRCASRTCWSSCRRGRAPSPSIRRRRSTTSAQSSRVPCSVDTVGFGGSIWRVSGTAPAMAAAAGAAADLLAREPGLDAVTLKRRLGGAGGGPMWVRAKTADRDRVWAPAQAASPPYAARLRGHDAATRIGRSSSCARLLDGRACVFGELLVGSAADRVVDHDEPVVRHAEHAAHQLGRAGKARRHHADRRDALPFRHDGVVQTAR